MESDTNQSSLGIGLMVKQRKKEDSEIWILDDLMVHAIWKKKYRKTDFEKSLGWTLGT